MILLVAIPQTLNRFRSPNTYGAVTISAWKMLVVSLFAPPLARYGLFENQASEVGGLRRRERVRGSVVRARTRPKHTWAPCEFCRGFAGITQNRFLAASNQWGMLPSITRLLGNSPKLGPLPYRVCVACVSRLYASPSLLPFCPPAHSRPPLLVPRNPDESCKTGDVLQSQESCGK